MVNPVLNVLHIVVGYGHSNVAEFVNHFLLRILTAVPNAIINGVQLLAERLLGLFSIDLA